jgi:hypothetical protein
MRDVPEDLRLFILEESSEQEVYDLVSLSFVVFERLDPLEGEIFVRRLLDLTQQALARVANDLVVRDGEVNQKLKHKQSSKYRMFWQIKNIILIVNHKIEKFLNLCVPLNILKNILE